MDKHVNSLINDLMSHIEEGGFTAYQVRRSPFLIILHESGIYLFRNSSGIRNFLDSKKIEFAPVTEAEKLFLDIGTYQASKHFGSLYENLTWDESEIKKLIHGELPF